LWILNFIVAKTNFITMCSASSYYFNSSPDGEGSAEVMQAVKFAYMNHFGSLAFGSFIIALIQFIRIVFHYFAEKALNASGESSVIKCIICCAECILKCIEKICDYINNAAYSYMAVSGDSFCSSAW
jgi:choline transporter-like protein 2/4/5